MEARLGGGEGREGSPTDDVEQEELRQRTCIYAENGGKQLWKGSMQQQNAAHHACH